MMTIVDKIFTFKKITPFDRLNDSEIEVIAEVAKEQFLPSEKIISFKGEILYKLYIIIEGEILTEAEGKVIPAIFGFESLLFNIPLSDTLKASSEGANCLVISKGHFFTMMYECPELILGFLESNQISTKQFFQFLNLEF